MTKLIVLFLVTLGFAVEADAQGKSCVYDSRTGGACLDDSPRGRRWQDDDYVVPQQPQQPQPPPMTAEEVRSLQRYRAAMQAADEGKRALAARDFGLAREKFQQAYNYSEGQGPLVVPSRAEYQRYLDQATYLARGPSPNFVRGEVNAGFVVGNLEDTLDRMWEVNNYLTEATNRMTSAQRDYLRSYEQIKDMERELEVALKYLATQWLVRLDGRGYNLWADPYAIQRELVAKEACEILQDRMKQLVKSTVNMMLRDIQLTTPFFWERRGHSKEQIANYVREMEKYVRAIELAAYQDIGNTPDWTQVLASNGVYLYYQPNRAQRTLAGQPWMQVQGGALEQLQRINEQKSWR